MITDTDADADADTDADGSTRVEDAAVVARNGAFSTRLCAWGEEEAA